jgi:hypothetical protein
MSPDIFRPTVRILRQFAGIWIVFFGATAIVQEVQAGRRTVAMVLALVALTIGPLGLVWPKVIKPIFLAWMLIAFPIGWVVSHAVLWLLYFGLFTPIAWIFRVRGRDELRLEPDPSASSYWVRKPSALDKSQYLRQF